VSTRTTFLILDRYFKLPGGEL